MAPYVRAFQLWLLRGLAVEVPVAIVGIVVVYLLYRSHALSGSAFFAWLTGVLLLVIVPSTAYQVIGVRRYAAARSAALGTSSTGESAQ